MYPELTSSEEQLSLPQSCWAKRHLLRRLHRDTLCGVQGPPHPFGRPSFAWYDTKLWPAVTARGHGAVSTPHLSATHQPQPSVPGARLLAFRAEDCSMFLAAQFCNC